MRVTQKNKRNAAFGSAEKGNKVMTMVKTEIVYRNTEGVLVNKVFGSFEAASGFISYLDRNNISYDWYEFRNGQWRDASDVTVMQDDKDYEDLLRYLAGQAA